ncbi:MAG: diacylglycerol kinase family protein [Chitinophagales bacterium]
MTFFQKEFKKFQAAFLGIGKFIQSATHAKWHLTIAVLVIIAGWFFCIAAIEWIAILLCIGFVLTAEAINESIERTCDFIHSDYHAEIGKIKDIAAGAVLIAAIISVVIGAIIFLPRMLDLLQKL